MDSEASNPLAITAKWTAATRMRKSECLMRSFPIHGRHCWSTLNAFSRVGPAWFHSEQATGSDGAGNDSFCGGDSFLHEVE